MDRSLARLSRNWTSWGRKDPLFAVLTDERHKGNAWQTEAFFATGRAEIREVLDDVRGLLLPIRTGRALDFGCGVGRLTQALADHFEECVGVDIAQSMVDKAWEFNRHDGRCCYVVNESAGLGRFEDGSFDFVYSNIVLQHMPPELSTGYVREFIRVLAPGGVAVFSCPARPGTRQGPAKRLAWLGKEAVRSVVNSAGRVVSLVPFPRMEMHCVPQSQLEQLIHQSGARLVEAKEVPWGAPKWVTVRYTVQKPDGAAPNA